MVSVAPSLAIMIQGAHGLSVQRSVSIIPGLRVNLSKSGASLSIGGPRRFTIGPRGRRVTTSRPGTGLYWTEQVPPTAPPHASHENPKGTALSGEMMWWVGAAGRYLT